VFLIGKATSSERAIMKIIRIVCFCVLAGVLSGVCLPCSARDVIASSAHSPRDGRHDFDFNIGVWKTHIRRILNPFASSSGSMELNGTVTVRKVWDGRAQLEEIEADGPKGHWEGLTLFVYNPEAHQWSQTFVDGATGVYGGGLVGEFKDGRGELFASDTFNGRSVLIRGTWSDITPDAHHFEEDYSDDGGKTWFPAFIASLTRMKQ
jgi:hypothetical protein